MNVAAIDIGTNSVRLLVQDEQGRALERQMQITRLGEGVDEARRLAEAAMQRTTQVLEEYAQRLRAQAVTRLRMTATSAARDASNRADFFARVQHVVGQAPELLSGDDEAKLSFLGATQSLPRKGGAYVVFDIGGGSTEFALGVNLPTAHLSIDVGAVRVTERYLAGDPPKEHEIARADQAVRALLERVQSTLRANGTERWVGLAGTVTSFAARAAGVAVYSPERTHGLTLSRQFVREFTAELLSLGTAERARLLLEPKRAGVIVGGAIVLRAIMEHFALSEIESSEHDILDGLAASLLA